MQALLWGQQASPGCCVSVKDCFCVSLPFPFALYGFPVIGAMTGLGPQASCVSSRFNEPYQKTLEPLLVLWFLERPVRRKARFQANE